MGVCSPTTALRAALAARAGEKAMVRLSNVVLALVFLSALSIPVAAAASGTYRVSATLAHAGEAFAAPVAVVRADGEARVEVSGENGYSVAFTVRDLAADRIQVDVALDYGHGSIAPTVVVQPDTPATVSVGDLSLEITVSRTGG